MKRQDLTGMKFGKLTIVGLDGKRKGKLYWDVVCECGNEKSVRGSSLKAGDTTSCGTGLCMGKIEDLTGMKFGKLLGLGFSHIEDGRAIYMSRCDCGKMAKTQGKHLRSGVVSTCTKCPVNTYYPKSGYMVGVTSDGNEFIFDVNDMQSITKFNWHISNGYVVSKEKGKIIRLHRLLMDPPEAKEVDHINGEPSDNRRLNLRVCTRQQNAFNSRQLSHSKQKYKGILQRSSGKWRARITLNDKRISIGQYETEEQAAIAYNEKAKELFGEYALLNKILKS